MNYKPCTWCPIKKTCVDTHLLSHLVKVMNQQDGILIHGLRFDCAKRQALFTPGMRVQVAPTEWFMVEEIDHQGDGHYVEITVPREGEVKTISATVMHWAGDKVRVWLDEPIAFHERHNVRVKIKPNKLVKLDEPALSVCKSCGRPKGKENDEGWMREKCEPYGQMANDFT